MIKNSILYYGMPMTGKSTRLQKIFLKTLKQSKGHQMDLAINLWQFYHRSKKWAKIGTTSNFIGSPHGVIPAMQLPFDPMKWEQPLQAFKAQHPVVKHILLDECYCIKASYLDALIMCCRDLWPHAQVIMGSIDFDSWHHKMANIDVISKMAEKAYHLNHTCMLCHKHTATRRLHIIRQGRSTWTPYYDERKYSRKIANPKTRRKATMLSVCSQHYHISVSKLNALIKQNRQNNMKKYKRNQKPTWHFKLSFNRKDQKTQPTQRKTRKVNKR